MFFCDSIPIIYQSSLPSTEESVLRDRQTVPGCPCEAQ